MLCSSTIINQYVLTISTINRFSVVWTYFVSRTEAIRYRTGSSESIYSSDTIEWREVLTFIRILILYDQHQQWLGRDEWSALALDLMPRTVLCFENQSSAVRVHPKGRLMLNVSETFSVHPNATMGFILMHLKIIDLYWLIRVYD